jgi:hypothetical protein
MVLVIPLLVLMTVTVVDNIVPTITCPANITVNVDAGTLRCCGNSSLELL